MAEYKKGGLTGNSNLYATNRLFVKNPLFKKRKKKAPGVYSPTAKFRYKEGGVSKDPSVPELTKAKDGGNPGDPFLKRLMSQIKKGNESKKPAPSLTRKAPKQPTSNSFSNKSLLNKEIQQQRNRNKTLEQTFPEVEIIGKRPMPTIHGEIPDSFTENLVEFFDPSGYFSWDDANQAHQNWQGSDNMLPSIGQAADMFGAVPVLGKFGKLKYLVEGEGLVKSAYKYFPWQQVVNAFDTVDDIETDNVNKKKNGGAIQDLSEEEIQKYIDSGYIVEEVNDPSIPKLGRFGDGGSPKSQWIAPSERYSGRSNVDPKTGLIYKDFGDVDVKAGKKGFKNRVKSFFQKDIGKLTKEAEDLGKGVGYIAGVQGDIEPAVYNREGIKKFKSEVKRLKGDFSTELKDAEKKRKQEAKDREDYEQARKKAQSSKDPNAGSNFAKKYEEKGWSKFDQATMKEGSKGQFQDAVDEANARKEANMGVTTTALELLGGGAYRVVADPLGTAKGVGQTVADVVSLPVGLTTGVYNYATEGNFDMGKNIIGQNYGEGLSQTGDVLSAIPGLGAAGKLAKFTKAGDAVGDLGKFVTTQTPIKNTYKLLGKDSKFFNPGETPHWRKGYQETWNPDVADLNTLDEFVEAKNLRNVPEKIKQQHLEVGQKLQSKVKELNNQADEAIKAGNIEEGVRLRKESMHALKESNDAKTAVINDYQASLLPKKSPFKGKIGEGSFGKVYDIEGSKRVVKLGKIPSNENLEELIKRGQGLEDRSNIAVTTRSHRLPSGDYATVMNKVDDVSGTGMPTKESYQQLITDVDELQNKGLYLDFQNTDNIVFNPATGKYNLYDLNTTGHYMSRRVTPEMGFSFKADPTFQGIQVPVTEGKSAKDILKAHSLIPDDFRKGGSTTDAIEIDIPEEEIQWYIDNGYIVEPVSKLQKFIG